MRIFIPGSVPSSKNGKRVIRTGNRTIVLWSKSAMRYVEQSKDEWEKHREEFINAIQDLPKPYRIKFHFIRGTRHKWDFVNPLQTVQDLMVKYGYLEDDNVHEMLPFPLEINGECWSYDKKNPGVYIEIE